MSFNARAAGLDLSAGETVELAAEAGFGGVDILVRDLVDAGQDPGVLRARMDTLGLRGGAFPLPVNWRESEAQFARDLERLPRYAGAAAVLGTCRTGTWVLPETPQPNGSGDLLAETIAWHVERLGKIARVLDREGIGLGLEVIGVASSRSGRGLTFIHRMADLDRVLGAVWHEAPNLGVVLDSWHLYAAREPVEAGLAWGAGRVVWAHVADLPASATANRGRMHDQNRGLPGEHGAIDSRRMLARLAELGYRGPVTAEPMAGSPGLKGLSPDQAVRRIAAALQSVWPESSERSP